MLSSGVFIICVYNIYTIHSPKTIQFVAAPTNDKEGRNIREGIVISVNIRILRIFFIIFLYDIIYLIMYIYVFIVGIHSIFVKAPANGKEGRNSREGIVISVIREGQEASADQK